MTNQTILPVSVALLAIILSISYVSYTKRKYKNTLLRVKRLYIEELLEAQDVPPMDYLRISLLWKQATSDASFDSSYFRKLATDFLTKKVLAMNSAEQLFLIFDSYTRAINPIVPDESVIRLMVGINTDVKDNTWSHIVKIFERKFKEILNNGDGVKKEEFLKKFNIPALYKNSDVLKNIFGMIEQEYAAAE